MNGVMVYYCPYFTTCRCRCGRAGRIARIEHIRDAIKET